ncbi:MAG: (d)CMP kinase [bacterium]
MEKFQVAIDGPAGSGKSTISKLVASKLGFNHIDTGAMYRAVTLEALNRKIDIENESEYGFLNEIDFEYKNDKILLNGTDVSKEIRSTTVTANVSAVARLKVVRDSMVSLQQNAANKGCVVMDGRDIGYVVLPNANVKVYLTASVEERARRRLLQETNATFEEILKDIEVRDFKDSNREISPLKQADDAILLDTTGISIEQVVEKIIMLVKERI